MIRFKRYEGLLFSYLMKNHDFFLVINLSYILGDIFQFGKEFLLSDFSRDMNEWK